MCLALVCFADIGFCCESKAGLTPNVLSLSAFDPEMLHRGKTEDSVAFGARLVEAGSLSLTCPPARWQRHAT